MWAPVDSRIMWMGFSCSLPHSRHSGFDSLSTWYRCFSRWHCPAVISLPPSLTAPYPSAKSCSFWGFASHGHSTRFVPYQKSFQVWIMFFFLTARKFSLPFLKQKICNFVSFCSYVLLSHLAFYDSLDHLILMFDLIPNNFLCACKYCLYLWLEYGCHTAQICQLSYYLSFCMATRLFTVIVPLPFVCSCYTVFSAVEWKLIGWVSCF